MRAVDSALSLSLDERPARVAVFRDALQSGAAPAAVANVASPAPSRAKTGGGSALKIVIPAVLLVVAAGVGYLMLGRPSSAPAAPAPTVSTPSTATSTATDDGTGAASPSPSASTAAAPADAAPPPGASPLDKLAQDLLVRDRKAQADAKTQQDLKDKAEREKRLKEAAEKALAAGEKPPVEKTPEKPAEKLAEKPADKPARAATPSAEESAAARTRALEEEIARLKAERNAPVAAAPVTATPATDADSQRAARESKNAETALITERERQKQIVARALQNCRIPAPTLSAAGNLIYDTAMRVPGAERVGSAIRLPAFTTADGDTQQFEVMPDSCARKVN